MYNQVTHDVEVSVMPVYIDERSNPEDNSYFWAYRVVIRNHGQETLQLISRFWLITDANGKQERVTGAGVVGEQPVLKPGEEFEYTSGCPLTTSSGIMAGHYLMKRKDGSTLTVKIPAFSLDLPDIDPIYN